jgi:hypothetical protein
VKASDRTEAAALLRRVLDAVDRGALAADGPAAVAVVRRCEGAVIALEVIDRRRPRST